jgi:ABC-type nitrate/sulfonate/bicarbonate transport system substrate-binding protein
MQDKPEEIKRVIRAGIKANRYIRANRDGTIEFLMDWLKLNREVATATYDGVVKIYDDDINVCEKSLRLVIEETKKTVKSSREISFNDIADLSILRETQREMGSK